MIRVPFFRVELLSASSIEPFHVGEENGHLLPLAFERGVAW